MADRTHRLVRSASCLLPFAVCTFCGCVHLGYERIQLGAAQAECRSAFPEERTYRTMLGLCCLERDLLGQTDAVVVLLTRDRRVACKLHAVHLERRGLPWLIGVETTYRLRGELDPQLCGLGGSGPVDTLRAIADELTAAEADTTARQAHAWVAAGLVRLLQRWPHSGDEGPALPRLTEMLERVPSAGVARITVDSRGVYLLEYAQAVTH